MNNKTDIDIKYVSPLKKILMTIGELPTSYIETMSYYEMLVWFTEFLRNQVIPTVNNNAEAVSELQTLYEELRNYVNNYFDNLDVQDEINNKLDEMAESGQLTDIIAQYLGLAGMIAFDSVADMKLAENLVNGSKCRTLGYYSVNDGGGAYYKIRPVTNDDVIDETSIIAVYDDLLVAELISDEVNLNQFACYGDGIHDDTTALQNAINYAVANGKTITSSNDKVYLLNNNITIEDTNINLSNCTFKTDDTVTITCFEKILNLPKIESISELSTNTAIDLHECYTCEIFVPKIIGFTTGLQLSADSNGCCYNKVNIQEIRDCLTSLKLKTTSSGWVNENMFIGGRLWATSTFTTDHGADIIKIHIIGTSTHYSNNNYFLKQCLEGNEGALNGLKLKLEYARTNTFEDLRYEGTNPKIDSTNSQQNYLNNGFGLIGMTFVNDKLSYNFSEVTKSIISAGSLNGVYLDITPGSNSYPAIQTRRITDGTVATKITSQYGFIPCDASGVDAYRFNQNGLYGAYTTSESTIDYFAMVRAYGGNTLLASCDGTSHALVINSGTNVTGGAYLWVYNGHLYGKMGKPSTSTDGTQIL